jgi:Protein of unknown function (DUF3073)
MGRGRAKAKQTKVARELKYNAPVTDLDALQRELTGSSGTSGRLEATSNDTDDETDDYEADEDDDWASGR